MGNSSNHLASHGINVPTFDCVLNITYNLHTLRGDVFGGLTAAAVSLPVSMAFGIASGLGPVAGLYGAVLVGFLAVVFGGTRAQISGPASSMTVAMAVIVTSHTSDLAQAFTIVIMAGLLQALIGALRIGRFVSYTPYSVISGFMSAVGIIITLVHTLPFLGAPIAPDGPVGAIRYWPKLVDEFNLHAFLIAAVTLALATFWPSKLNRYMPATLAALCVGILLGVLLLTGAPSIGPVPSGFPSPQLPDFSTTALLSAVEPAVVLALVGSIHTLLTSLVADSRTLTHHNPDRELLAQGVGNMAAGFMGLCRVQPPP